MAKKALKLEPYRQSKLQTFTVEIFCHKGERMPAPVKRVKGCWMDPQTQGYTVMCAWTKQRSLSTRNRLELVFASVVLQADGIWVYGMEQVSFNKTYYQVWHLLPEPNEFTTEEDNAKKRVNRSGRSGKASPS